MTKNKDRWAELILESVGDDPERAKEFYTEYRKWMIAVAIEIMVGLGILILTTLGICFGTMDDPPGEKELINCLCLFVGAILGTMMVFTRDSMEIKLKRRMDNIEYHEKKMEEEQCR